METTAVATSPVCRWPEHSRKWERPLDRFGRRFRPCQKPMLTSQPSRQTDFFPQTVCGRDEIESHLVNIPANFLGVKQPPMPQKIDYRSQQLLLGQRGHVLDDVDQTLLINRMMKILGHQRRFALLHRFDVVAGNRSINPVDSSNHNFVVRFGYQ